MERLEGGEAALEALEGEGLDEGLAEGEMALDDVEVVAGNGGAVVLKLVAPELGLDEARAADDPLIADNGVVLARSCSRAETGRVVVFDGEAI